MPKEEEHRFHVLVNRERIEPGSARTTAAELLKGAGFKGKKWDLLRLEKGGDPGGVPLDHETVLELTDGEHFRAIPGDRTFG